MPEIAVRAGRTLGLAAVAAVAILVLAPGPASASGLCGRPGAVVVRSSPIALIVRSRGEYRRYWACLRSTGRPVLIGVDGTRGSDEEHLEMPTLGGPFAAALTYDCLAECAPSYVEVFDLRTRRGVSSIGTDPLKLLLGVGGGVAIVKRDAGRRWLQVWDARGLMVVTGARERDLPLRSVWMQGDLLRWTQAGVPHSFLLRGRSRQG